MEEETENPEVQPPAKETKSRAPRKNAATKSGIVKDKAKKESNPRPAPRPYKKMCVVKLTTSIEQLHNKQEEMETKLKVNSIRLRKYMAEATTRKNMAE